ncbi:MAG: hypothetical protein WA865_08685 [Spirulinaceae cyanobacterium]
MSQPNNIDDVEKYSGVAISVPTQLEFQKVNKRISQLIAKKWLEGAELTESDVLEIVKDNAQGGKDDREYKIIIDTQPYSRWKEGGHYQDAPPVPPDNNYEGYFIMSDRFFHSDPELQEPAYLYVPFPERPPEEKVSNEVLNDWVEQDPGVAPFYPTNTWIPYTC